MTTRKDLRDLKRITREVTMWAREIERLADSPMAAPIVAALVPPKRPPKPAPPPRPKFQPLPPEYSPVTCKDCDAPAILIRGRDSFAALCPSCRVITHLESIEPESTK